MFLRCAISLLAIAAAVPGPAAAQTAAPSSEPSQGPRGPVFVPLDSWIYPVLTRLAALGYVPDQAAGMRPWTRKECMRQVFEAEAILARQRGARLPEAARLVEALRREFAEDPGSGAFLELDSLYLRATGISGRPLIDGYNFGQTIINDNGRPYGEGAGMVAGVTADAAAGPFSFYTRSELQHAPAYSSPAGALASQNRQIVPVLPDAPGGVDRFQPLETYVGVGLGNWAFTAGRQNLWWGTGEAGPLSFGDNAAPFLMFRFTSASPFALPGFLRRLGVFRLDLIGGELSGHRFPPRPLVNGQKITWNLTGSLEVGFTRWSLFGGAGVHGFTAGSVIRNLFANGATFGDATDPGDRKSGFDFRWRPPVAGRWISLYAELYADDEPSPLTSPRRSAFSPGIYLARLPGLSHWDLRAEAPSTRGPASDRGGLFFYWNNVYRDANTNSGQILGTWAGRDGRGLFLQTTYWRSARSCWEFSYRQNRVGAAFLPGGGTQEDASAGGSFSFGTAWTVTAFAQYERYSVPVISGPTSDFAVSAQILYTPRWRLERRH
jgi:hypothetical protein